MRYLALAADYDGTLASGGRVSAELVQSLTRLRASGRKLVLVTGRRLEDLARVFPEHRIFDRVVAENGALLCSPAAGEVQLLAGPAPPVLAARLAARGVDPLFCGRVLLATLEPHRATAGEVIRELGLDWQLVLNRGSVMLLPGGVDKGSGLAAALTALGLAPGRVVGVGDAENDEALLKSCGCGVAVGDAVESLKECADLVMELGNGRGVMQLVERILADDLRGFGRE